MLEMIDIALHYVLFVLALFGILMVVAGIVNTIQHLWGNDVDEVHLNIHVYDEHMVSEAQRLLDEVKDHDL